MHVLYRLVQNCQGLWDRMRWRIPAFERKRGAPNVSADCAEGAMSSLVRAPRNGIGGRLSPAPARQNWTRWVVFSGLREGPTASRHLPWPHQGAHKWFPWGFAAAAGPVMSTLLRPCLSCGGLMRCALAQPQCDRGGRRQAMYGTARTVCVYVYPARHPPIRRRRQQSRKRRADRHPRSVHCSVYPQYCTVRVLNARQDRGR